MNKIIELLNENADWYLNRSCLGESLERNPIVNSWCDKCGDYKGVYKSGRFSFFLKDILMDSLKIEMLNEAANNPFLIVYLIERDYKITEHTLESDEYSAEEVTDILLNTQGFRKNVAAQMYIEGKSYTVTFGEISAQVIVDAVKKILE